MSRRDWAMVAGLLTLALAVIGSAVIPGKGEPEPATCTAEFERRGVKFTVTWDDPRECNRLVRPSAPTATPARPTP